MSFSAHSTLEKMKSSDKDFRYMAARDLVTELEKSTFKMDADTERKLTNGILKLLEDSSNQVQEMAVKSLSPLIKKASQTPPTIVETLCDYVLSEKKDAEELRDVASLGLKSIISEIPSYSENSNLASTVIKKATPKLITGIKEHFNNHEIVFVCLEILNDLLSRFGSHMEREHENILKVVQPQLSSKRATSRKKAIGCLEHLASTIPDNLFTNLMQFLQQKIKETSSESEELRTYIQALGAVSRSVGYRVGNYLPEICPLLIKYCDIPEEDGDEDLRESCIQCFEILSLRCPKEISPFVSQITGLCLKYIKYDPNYVDEGEDMEMEESEEEEEEDEEFADDYSDDDDMSWKVRRASSKCLSALINTRPDMLEESYAEIAPALIVRFKEREENVKLDIFQSFGELLKQTTLAVKRNPAAASQITHSLREMVPKIIGNISKQLKDKSSSIKIRSGIFSLLKDLVIVLNGGLENHITALVPGIQLALGDKHTSAKLKIEGLEFLQILMHYHDPSVFYPHVKDLSPLINKSISDSYYRTSAGGLKAGCEFVHVLKTEGKEFDCTPYVKNFFEATLEKLKVQDIDQEVKESAINCIALIVSKLGDQLQSEIPGVLKILVDRLSNEITRLSTVRALDTIASSSLKIDMTSILEPAMKEMSTFLRKTNRQLKQSSLTTLSVLIQNFASYQQVVNQLPTVLSETAPIISDSDLHLSHLSLNLCVIILSSQPSLSKQISSVILPKVMELLQSSLLQGLALESLLKLLSLCVKVNENSFDELLKKIQFIIKQETPKHVVSNCAKAIASISLSTSNEKCSKTIVSFTKQLKEKDDISKQLAMYCLGEIGRNSDLSSYSIHDLLLSNFESQNEEIRQAASFAFGNIAVGNLDKYLPQVLSDITKETKARYLLLHSLKEIIVRLSVDPKKIEALHQHQGKILPLLYQNCESSEEGTRNVVSECLGKLALVSPKELIPILVERAKSNDANTRATVVSSLKFAIVERPHQIDDMLHPNMSTFLDLLKDQDLNVRRNTLLTINYAAHNKPMLIRELLPTYLPLLFGESKVKQELIREVDLGPFKYKKDDGLEIRKAAFECMYTLLDTCLDRIDISDFVTNLVDALKDHYDIKMLAHLILIRCSHVAGTAMLPNLDQLVEPLRTTITTKPKEGAVKQEVERNDELVRSALRAIAAITKIPNHESNQKFSEFLRQTVTQDELGKKYAAIKSESESSLENTDKMEIS